MKYFLNLLGPVGKLTPFILSLVLLAACSSVQPGLPATPTTDTYTHSLSVDIDASSLKAEVEARYGGDVIVWRPEAGFAVLGLSGKSALSTQALEGAVIEPNQDEVAAPEAEVAASSVWGGGENVWSGGENVWSGGTDAISEPTLSRQNADIWWQVNLGGGLALAPRKGSGVKVAVIDSGIDLHHPAFSNRLAPRHEWKDFVDGDTYPQEERSAEGESGNYGHGTGVAGIVLQVAPNATILPLRVLGAEGIGDITDVAAAIDHALAWGADVINLSLGTNEDSEVLNRMLALAAERRVLITASSGNTGDGNITYPARNARVGVKGGAYLLSVGSVNAYNALSTFSTYGEALEMTAPGEFVYTAFPDNRVGYWSGTSFSAPMVAGTVALVLGEERDEKDVAKKLDELVRNHSLYYVRLNVRDFVGWVLD